jgi:hypothetical protein
MNTDRMKALEELVVIAVHRTAVAVAAVDTIDIVVVVVMQAVVAWFVGVAFANDAKN